MRKLILLALVGLGAQLVDGSLGMAYGVTSTTLLLAIGANPAAASATVHLAEIGTTLVSGFSHWRFGNVDWRVVLKIGLPGAVGAFGGVLVNLAFRQSFLEYKTADAAYLTFIVFYAICVAVTWAVYLRSSSRTLVGV